MTEAAQYIMVFVTTDSAEDAQRIARAVVTEQLAACVNITAPLHSVYRWQGQVECAEEHLLIMKSRAALFTALSERVVALHSYDTPEVIAVPIQAGHSAYLSWITANTRAVP